MMEYKGYVARIEFDNEASLFHGQVMNMRDVITFQGTTVEELRQEFADSVDDYLEFCAERGEAPEKPFSGRFLIRIEPTLHRDIAIAATQKGQSINAWVTEKLSQAIHSGTFALPTTRWQNEVVALVKTMSQNSRFAHSEALIESGLTLQKTASFRHTNEVLIAPKAPTLQLNDLSSLLDLGEIIEDAC